MKCIQSVWLYHKPGQRFRSTIKKFFKESGRPRNLLFYIIYFTKTMTVVFSCQLFINLLYTYLTKLFLTLIFSISSMYHSFSHLPSLPYFIFQFSLFFLFLYLLLYYIILSLIILLLYLLFTL